MSILDRLNLLVRANLNEVSARAGSAWQGTLRDMESSLRDAHRQLAELRADERRLVDQVRAKREKVDQWEDRAMMALKSSDEDLAREAIIIKNQTMREVERLREQLDSHRTYMRDMESSLEALQVKLDASQSRMRNERGAIVSGQGQYTPSTPSGRQAPRHEDSWDAELRRRLADRNGDAPVASASQAPRTPAPSSRPYLDSTPFDTDTSFETMDRMAQNIAEMEARVDAASELSGDDDLLIDPRRRELDNIFDKMETNKKTGDDLNDLKRKFSED